jgi:hypothetical protein
MSSFNWEDIDHSLVQLKTTTLAEKMHKSIQRAEACIRYKSRGNLNDCAVPTLILRMKQRNADRSARRIYAIYCDVWQTQGYPKSAAFIREVCSQAVVPAIRARANAIAGEFAMFAWRTNFSPEIGEAMLKSLDRDMKQLQSRWERQLEAEAKECEHAERRRLREALGASGSGLNGGKPGRKPRLSQDFVVCAGTLWRTAILQSGTYVSVDRLREIASALDAAAHLPPADYLEGKYAKDVKQFNSRHSNSKTGPLLTWSKLVSHGDKDHIQGMRRLLARCADKLGRGHPPSGINSGQKISS